MKLTTTSETNLREIIKNSQVLRDFAASKEAAEMAKNNPARMTEITERVMSGAFVMMIETDQAAAELIAALRA